MADATGRLWITYNGEIFNFLELRSELTSHGHVFRSGSDTEVILAAYREWGIDCLQRLNGMFAFGLWDADRRMMYLVRDRLGVKPLYWTATSNHAVFASTLTPFATFADVPRELDEEALGLYFQLMYVPAPLSIYRGIRKLLPGSYLAISASGAVEEKAYWRITAAPTDRGITEEDALARIEDLLLSSVKLRLVSDVPIGAFLSGGIDSSTVVAMMRRHTDEVRTFTIGFAEPRFDEAPYARAIAQHLGTQHTEAVVTASDLLQLAKDVPVHFDEPFADASAIPTLALARMTRRQVTVALSGDGGDELFGGYSYYRHLRRLEPARALASPARPLLRALGRADLPYRAKLGLRALASRDTESLYAYMRGPLKALDYEALIRRPFPPAPRFFGEVLAREVPDGDRIQRYMDLDLRTYLPDDILAKVDRATMAWGLEGRNPFLDWRLVEFVHTLPLDLKCGSGGKGLLRKLLARYLPRELFERPKMGFGIPIRQWFRNELRDAVSEAVLGGHLAATGYLDRNYLARMLAEHASARQNHDSMLWAILVFEQWHQHYRGR